MSSLQTAALPDVNAETYPYDFVQQLLDQTADFSFFSIPDPGHADAAILTPDTPDDYFGLNGGYGIDLASTLHRFDSVLQPPEAGRLAVHQAVGESGGTLRCRWFFGPEDFPWQPGQLPPPAIYDPWRSQRFAFRDGVFDLGGGHGFNGYGVGRTFPVAVDGRPRLLAGAVGNVTAGTGRFAGLEGTFVMTGTLTPALGFLGNITCRIVDPGGRLRSPSDLPPLSAMADPDPDSTFLVLRGEKKDRTVRTTYGPPPDARRVSLITPSQMRAMRYGFVAGREHGPRARASVHQIAGTMEANVFFDLLAPPGTAERPVPFTTDETYEFQGPGGVILGTVQVGVVEGISFGLTFPAAPGQPGVRFSGFGPIKGGTGVLEGAQGMLTVNSLIGISPHALSLLHVLQLIDPERRRRG
jgi:hypothetical protein